MISLFKKSLGGSFRRSVLQVAGGSVLSQGLLILFMPVLTRLYGPDEFGVYLLFVAIVTALLVVCAFRYECAIPVPESPDVARRLLGLSVRILALVALAAAGVLWLLGRLFSAMAPLGAPAMLLAFAVALLALGLQQIFNHWSIRQQDFKRISYARCWQSIGTVAGQLLLSLVWKDPRGLIFGYVAGQCCGALFAVAGLAPNLFRQRGSWPDYWGVAKQFKDFALFSTWSAALSTTGNQAPFFFLSGAAGAVATGYFGLAMRVMFAPVSLMSQAISQVFFSRIPQAHRDGQLGTLVLDMSSRLTALSLPLTLILCLAGPGLFGWIFGAQWADAGVYARYLAPWACLVFVTGPISKILAVTGQQAGEFRFQIASLSVRLGALAIGAWLSSARWMIVLFAFASAFTYSVYLGWLLAMVGAGRSYLRSLPALAVPAALAVAPVVGTLLLFPNRPALLLLSAMLAAALAGTRYWLRFHRRKPSASKGPLPRVEKSLLPVA